MNYKQFNVALPIKDNNVSVISGLIRFDTANIINVKLMDGLEAFDFTGYTEVYIDVLKPDGTHVQSVVTDDVTFVGDNNPYSIQVVSPQEGRISFTLLGNATVLPGTHFAQIMIASNGKLLTTARLNYHVDDTLMDPDVDLTSSNEYTTLLTLINRNSAIATAERTREDSEAMRIGAEYARQQKILDMEAEINAYLANAEGYVSQTEDYMNLAQQYAQLAQSPSAEILSGIIADMSLVSEAELETAIKDFDAGLFTDVDPRLLKVRTGTSANRPALAEGELGFATDTKRLYCGDTVINGVYHVGATAPSETHILWVDTSAGGVIKYHNGTAWLPTATAAFS